MTETNSAALAGMKMPELQSLATSLGVKNISKLRKAELVEAIGSSAGGSASGRGSGAQQRNGSERQMRDGDSGSQREGAQRESAQREGAQREGAQRESGPREGGSREGAQRESGPREGSPQRDSRRGPRRAAAPAGSPDDQERAKRDLMRDLESATARIAEDREDRDDRGERNYDRGERSQGDRGQGGRQFDRDNDRRRSRDRGRSRGRDRDRRGAGPDNTEPEIREDDIVVPVAGILDVLENYAFVRTSGYLPGPNDVYVTLGQVKKYGLRRGDAVTGAVRQPEENDQRNSRQKFNALVRLDTVNGMTPEEALRRPEFQKLTPLYPNEMLRLETTPKAITPRVIDLVAPVGKGQRGLIVAPPKAGKTIVMQQLANAIAVNNPEVHLMVVLVDERPEEVTDMQRMVKGEVIASTFDRPASDHTIVAELAIERAKRLVEMGGDVVVLLDSLTRLSRAYNLAAPTSGRILSGGVDASALYPPKKFFGAARKIEGGGSLTIIASALVETGSKMDEVIFEEFKGTGNLELRLSRQLADKRIFPAVDVNASGTRREELLLSNEELKIVWRLRRIMGGLEKEAAIELLLGKLRDTQSNAEFLLAVSRTTPGGKDELAELAAGTGRASADNVD